MSDSLRDGLVEEVSLFGPPDWDEAKARAWAGHVVDVLLDYLTDHADEWADAWEAAAVTELRVPAVARLLAVLRPNTVGSEQNQQAEIGEP